MIPETNAWNADPTSPSFLLAEAAALWALTEKAEDVVLLDLRGRSDVCDFFLICTGHTDVQTLAIAETVQKGLAAGGQEPLNVEGLPEGRWVLLDYFDVVIHVFQPETRAYYLLERLWGDAPRLDVPEDHIDDAVVRERHPELAPPPRAADAPEEPDQA